MGNADDEELREWSEGLFSSRELDDCVEACVSAARGFFADNPGTTEWCGRITVYMDKKDGKRQAALIGVPEVPGTAEERRRQMESLGAKLADEGMSPVAAVSMFESWSAICEPGEDMSVRPSERPDRKEVIAFAGMTADGRTAMSCADIVRGPDGGISLGEARAVRRASDPGEGECSNFLLEAMFRGFVARSYELISGLLVDLIKGKSGKAPDKPDWDDVIRSIPDGVPEDMG